MMFNCFAFYCEPFIGLLDIYYSNSKIYFGCFNFFVGRAKLDDARGLLLSLYSGITPGHARETISDAEDQM